MLDVVYNHIGPDGNFLGCYSPDYFTDRYPNEWGAALNFDGPNARAVREYFIGNACYWIREFHLDGLRLDATQSMHDASHPHVIAELAQRVRAAGASAQDHPRRGERAAARRIDDAAGGRRLRLGCDVERRFSSRRAL
jgi:maltooligosyltrehalose trehalohydrolase